jgi:predicted enzyme related to lactoylglutathione lyase
MSDRERWIVYPLLFYALVMGWKSTYRDPMEFRCRTIECQQLKVQLINGSDARAMAAPRGPAQVIVYQADAAAGAAEPSVAETDASEATSPPAAPEQAAPEAR